MAARAMLMRAVVAAPGEAARQLAESQGRACRLGRRCRADQGQGFRARSADAVADLQGVVATTGRGRDLSQRIVTPRRAAGEMRVWIAAGEAVGILFGPERTGLTNDDLVHADTALSIPLNPQFSSMNVAQAVLLVAYEWLAAGEDTAAERMSDHAARPGDQGRAAEPVRPSRTGIGRVGLPAEQGDAAGHGAQPARPAAARRHDRAGSPHFPRRHEVPGQAQAQRGVGMSTTAKISWVEGALFVAEAGSGHTITMDGAPDGGGRNLASRPDGGGADGHGRLHGDRRRRRC